MTCDVILSKKGSKYVARVKEAITIISAEELLRGRLAQIRRAVKPENRVEAYQWLSKTIDFLCGFTVLKFDEQAESHFQDFRAGKIKEEFSSWHESA